MMEELSERQFSKTACRLSHCAGKETQTDITLATFLQTAKYTHDFEISCYTVEAFGDETIMSAYVKTEDLHTWLLSTSCLFVLDVPEGGETLC